MKVGSDLGKFCFTSPFVKVIQVWNNTRANKCGSNSNFLCRYGAVYPKNENFHNLVTLLLFQIYEVLSSVEHKIYF